jgi:hypothetical protein
MDMPTTGVKKANPLPTIPTITTKYPGPFKPGAPTNLSQGKAKDLAARREKIKKGFRKGGPSKAQLGKIRLGAMKAEQSK